MLIHYTNIHYHTNILIVTGMLTGHLTKLAGVVGDILAHSPLTPKDKEGAAASLRVVMWFGAGTIGAAAAFRHIAAPLQVSTDRIYELKEAISLGGWRMTEH